MVKLHRKKTSNSGNFIREIHLTLRTAHPNFILTFLLKEENSLQLNQGDQLNLITKPGEMSQDNFFQVSSCKFCKRKKKKR